MNGAEHDREQMRRAARAAGIQVGDGETFAGKNALIERDGAGFGRVYDPLHQKDRAMDLVIKLGLAIAFDHAGGMAYAGSIGLPDGEHNPTQVPFDKHSKLGPAADMAMCRAIVAHAASLCEEMYEGDDGVRAGTNRTTSGVIGQP